MTSQWHIHDSDEPSDQSDDETGVFTGFSFAHYSDSQEPSLPKEDAATDTNSNGLPIEPPKSADRLLEEASDGCGHAGAEPAVAPSQDMDEPPSDAETLKMGGARSPGAKPLEDTYHSTAVQTACEQ
jgi:hypothetical protein